MRVLFVYRNAEWLGIEYLSAVLKQAGHETDLVFDPGIGDIEFKFEFLDRLLPIERRMVERAVRFGPDLIAVSCVTNLYPWAKRMMHLLKRATGKPIVIGGIHPTITPETVIQNPDVDYLIVGEGEEALLDLANALERGDERTDIPNVWFKRAGDVINNEIRPYTEDLDKYPFPDKEIFRQYGCFTSRIYVMTARGCPYHCTYCFNDRQQELYEGKGTYVRRRSVQNVMDELKYFRARYPIKEVFFYDDIFTIQKAWLREFAERYPREVGLPYKCLVRPDCLDGEMVDILKRTNCIYVDMGVEAGSPEVRARLDRAMEDETILAAGRRLKQAGIKFCTLNILGSPGETAEEMMRTYDLNLKLEPEGVITTVMYPFPGTEIMTTSMEMGYLAEEDLPALYEGEGGFKAASPLRHPYMKLVRQLQIFMPIALKSPYWLRPHLMRLEPNAFWRLVSVFFLSIPRNRWIRMKESLYMFLRSHWSYLTGS